MKPFRFLQEAKGETIEAALYYEDKAAGLGAEFLRQIQLALRQIAQFPEASALADVSTRRGMVKRFRYGIFYRIEADEVVVLAVGDLRRKPGYWRGRG